MLLWRQKEEVHDEVVEKVIKILAENDLYMRLDVNGRLGMQDFQGQ